MEVKPIPSLAEGAEVSDVGFSGIPKHILLSAGADKIRRMADLLVRDRLPRIREGGTGSTCAMLGRLSVKGKDSDPAIDGLQRPLRKTFRYFCFLCVHGMHDSHDMQSGYGMYGGHGMDDIYGTEGVYAGYGMGGRDAMDGSNSPSGINGVSGM